MRTHVRIPSTRPGTVYLLWALGTWFFKVGWTSKVRCDQRVESLQTACPHELRILADIPGTINDERAIHARFANHRAATNEWFELDEPAAWQMLDRFGVVANNGPVRRAA